MWLPKSDCATIFTFPSKAEIIEILKKMNRPYTREEYIALTKRIYKKIPDAAISADIIVGFPGESDGAFENTVDVLTNAEFAFIHSFPYSPREGTKAAIFPHRVPGELKEKRQKTLLSLGDFYKYRFAERHIWQTMDVLVESRVIAAAIARDIPIISFWYASRRKQKVFAVKW